MDTLGFLGTGISHERMRIPCQDALASRSMENGNRIWVLSDGAGSAEFAGQAARCNTEGILAFFGSCTLKSFLACSLQEQKKQLLKACTDALGRCSEEFVHRPWDFSATLLFFVWDGGAWLAGHLGDGFLLIQDRDGEPLVCSAPDNGERSSQTWFTVSPDAMEHLRLYTDPVRLPGRMLMISDGPCAMFRTRAGAYRETAEELLGYVRQGDITSAKTLADVLDQMTHYAYDRRDDWSVWLWDQDADLEPQTEITAQSMLEREMRKIEKQNSEEAMYEQEHGRTGDLEGSGPEMSD